jgi:hypothetical protein
MRTSHWLMLVVLLGLLAAVAWYTVSVWSGTPPMPLYGNIIMVVAATLALVAGSGLIALMFYSDREGYDDAAHRDRTRRK